MENYKEIGTIRKPHGLSGELKVTVGEEYLPILLEKGYLLIQSKGQMIPAFLENVRGQSPLILKFETMDKLEEVNVFTGCKIYMRFEDIKDAIVEQDKSDEWKGYTLINVNDNTTFQIHETRAYPMQTMLIVYKNGDEILIPLVSNWIEATDHDKKVLEMKLPEGLY